MLTCKQITEMATQRAEGALGLLDAARFDRHLARCAHCRLYVQQLETTVRALRRVPEPEISPRLNDALVAQFDAWASARIPTEVKQPVTPEVRATRRVTFWPTLAAAATLALLLAFARNRSQAPDDWLVGAALAALALAISSVAGRLAVGSVVAAVAAAVTAALVAGNVGPLDLATGVECVVVELCAAAAVAGATWLAVRSGLAVMVRRSVVAGGTAGALVGEAALQVTCGAHDALPHLLVFHAGTVLLVGVAGLLLLRRRAEPASA